MKLTAVLVSIFWTAFILCLVKGVNILLAAGIAITCIAIVAYLDMRLGRENGNHSS